MKSRQNSTIATKSGRGKSGGNSNPTQVPRPGRVRTERVLNNSDIAELLAQESEKARPPLQRAFRRAARRAFLWPEEASDIVAQNRSLAELSGIGPYLEKKIRAWMADPPAELPVPEIRTGFLSMPKAEAALAKKPQWLSLLKGDLQMHSNWSDGSGSIREMADAGVERNYEDIPITRRDSKSRAGLMKRNCRSRRRKSRKLIDRSKKLGQNFVCCVPSN